MGVNEMVEINTPVLKRKFAEYEKEKENWKNVFGRDNFAYLA
jgi:hypothetical protein